MPGRLRCDILDFNNPAVVKRVLNALARLARDPQNRHPLKVRNRYHFSTPGDSIGSDAGWYAICDAHGCIYVGTAENLNGRLNTDSGSRDDFADSQRKSDPKRNFIKAFAQSGVLGELTVVVIEETSLCSAVNVPSALTNRDRHNVEKVLDLFRGRIIQ